MSMKEMQKQIDWLTQTLIKVAKECHVNISNEAENTNAKIDNAVNDIYDSLPISVIAEMVEEECTECEEELFGGI